MSTHPICPSCKRDLAANQRGKHCPSKACKWLNCSCGAVIDSKRRLFMGGRK